MKAPWTTLAATRRPTHVKVCVVEASRRLPLHGLCQLVVVVRHVCRGIKQLHPRVALIQLSTAGSDDLIGADGRCQRCRAIASVAHEAIRNRLVQSCVMQR